MINRISSYNLNDKYKFKQNVHFNGNFDEVARIMRKKLLNGKSADIYGHIYPDTDPDAAVAAVDMYNFYRRNGIRRVSVSIDSSDKNLFFKIPRFRKKKNSKPADIALLVDVSEHDRISELYRTPNIETIKIFHKPSANEIEGYKYEDDNAKSSCAMICKLFERWGYELNKKEKANNYYAILDDLLKSKLVKFENSKLIKLPELDEDSEYILNKLGNQLSDRVKTKIYKRLDIISNLTKKEKAFQKYLFSKIEVTKNGKLAYVVIDPNDLHWRSVGMDTTRTSAILRDLRLRLINDVQNDDMYTAEQKEMLKNVKGSIIFYRLSKKPDSAYQMSIHSKGDYAMQLIDYIKKNINADLIADGRPNRAGGRVFSLDTQMIKDFINSFLEAAENVA